MPILGELHLEDMTLTGWGAKGHSSLSTSTCGVGNRAARGQNAMMMKKALKAHNAAGQASAHLRPVVQFCVKESGMQQLHIRGSRPSHLGVPAKSHHSKQVWAGSCGQQRFRWVHYSGCSREWRTG